MTIFFDVCIVDVRGIMTKGRFIDSYDYKEKCISRAEAIIVPFLRLPAAGPPRCSCP